MIKNLLNDDEPSSDPESESSSSSSRSNPTVISLFDTDNTTRANESRTATESPYDTPADTVRRSGLAYSAGIAFFAAVVFMMVLGWGADVLLGTSPWGIVGGIVLGSIIGFVQFFRISSQIFKK